MKLFRRFLIENWSYKLTAVLMASILWLLVRGDPTAERVISVPLVIQVPRNMEIINDRPTSVEVTVRGPFGNMAGAQPNFSYVINLEGEKEGEHIITLSRNDVRVNPPSGITVLKVSPARLSLILEATVTKEVPVVVPRTRGQPADGFDIYSVTHSPKTVVLSGPRSHIDAFREVMTDPVSVEGESRSFRTYVDLDLKDDSIHTNPVGPIQVEIQLGPHRQKQHFALTHISVEPEDSGFQVVDPRLSVDVLVPVTFDGKLSPENFQATVSVADLDPNATEARVTPVVKLTPELNPDIVIDQFRPAEVTVRKTKAKTN